MRRRTPPRRPARPRREPPLSVAIVTAAVARDLDDDLPPLLAALGAAGVAHRLVEWDDPGVDWSGFDLAVVRSVWDYTRRRDELLDWSERVASVVPLANPPAVLRWNTDKGYLLDLARAGVPIVPTAIAAPGEAIDWPEGETVVKPTVSAGSLDTDRYTADRRADAEAHVARLHAEGRAAMVQPYLSSVETRGELALVHMEGELTHTVRKGPMLMPGRTVVGGLFVEEDIRPAGAGASERDVARRALAAIPAPGPLLYSRVDLVFTAEGAPRVLELELVEPSLFLAHRPGAAERFAAAIARAGTRR